MDIGKEIFISMILEYMNCMDYILLVKSVVYKLFIIDYMGMVRGRFIFFNRVRVFVYVVLFWFYVFFR